MPAKKTIIEVDHPKVVYAKLAYPLWEWIDLKNGVTADPAAGNNPVEITVPAGKRWLIVSGNNTIACDATAVSRRLTLTLKRDGTNIDQSLYQGTAITASQTVTTNMVRGIANFVPYTAVAHVLGIDGSGIELPAGAKFQVTYESIQGGDNAGVFRYSYKERDA